jgi:predicted TPR repeat methyltransferase
MTSRVFKSSGDMMADRRFDYARDLQLRGDPKAAADLLLQAIELVPDFVSAWFTLGELREQLGDIDSAVAAFRRAKAADPGDCHGASLRLMRLTNDLLTAMPTDYVTALYDQYASKFEASLVGQLGYRGPELLLKAVLSACDAENKSMLFRRAIDLGCGTGLVARAFALQIESIIGIDLSSGMIAQARATRLYGELVIADAVDGLKRQADDSADLVIAADMMIYLHDLAPLMQQAARVLMPGGVLAFTAETHGGEGVVLGAGLRYAQSADHLRGLIADAGLLLAHVDEASIRTENQRPVPSLVMVATKR